MNHDQLIISGPPDLLKELSGLSAETKEAEEPTFGSWLEAVSLVISSTAALVTVIDILRRSLQEERSPQINIHVSSKTYKIHDEHDLDRLESELTAKLEESHNHQGQAPAE